MLTQRPLPDVDIVADIRRIPYEPGSLFEISSAHLIEHFREHQSRVVILPYWRSLLQPDGQLRIICPNWAAMLNQMNSGKMTLSLFKKITFGAQDYEGDDLSGVYTRDIGRSLREVGFSQVEAIVLDRMNGGCPEMEIVAKG
ncbi:MAG: hypothetical protein IPL71_00560 [Anaerolineales bacterium]|uniref:hypothetical protein n=1 Tax=Candidatus Villigracilis proximus TaxID=3140683 RepID=UPI003134EAD5|nr:hypothetical protein [Anaerolineales bacterium]